MAIVAGHWMFTDDLLLSARRLAIFLSWWQQRTWMTVCSAWISWEFAQLILIDFYKWRERSFKEGRVCASIDDYADVTLNGETYSCTLCTSCEMLVPTGKCANCVSYRASLWTMHTWWQKMQYQAHQGILALIVALISDIWQHHKRGKEWLHSELESPLQNVKLTTL